MKIKKTVTIVSLFLSFALFSQPQVSWVKKLGDGKCISFSIVTDHGDILIAGYFEGTVDFDPGVPAVNLTSSGLSDIFILKLNSAGKLIWVKQIGGRGSDEATAMTTDKLGNIYIAGGFSETVDFDPGLQKADRKAVGDMDIFLMKLNADGSFAWAKAAGGNSFDIALSITADENGHLFSTGIFTESCDFGATEKVRLTASGSYDAFICSYDASGSFSWTKKLGGQGADIGQRIVCDDAGNVYATGDFSGAAECMDKKVVSSGNMDVYLVKMDVKGNMQWITSFGGLKDEMVFSIALDSKHNILLTGSFGDTVAVGEGTMVSGARSHGKEDVFIASYNAAGKPVWFKGMGGPRSDCGYAIAADDRDNIYVTGKYEDSADLDPGRVVYEIPSHGESDVFIIKLNEKGNLEWIKPFGGNGNDLGYTLAVQGSNIFVSGVMRGAVNFDPGVKDKVLVGNAAGNIFILRLKE
jgi:hypothetical protein